MIYNILILIAAISAFVLLLWASAKLEKCEVRVHSQVKVLMPLDAPPFWVLFVAVLAGVALGLYFGLR